MNEPNPDDPLMEDISQQYKSDRQKFKETAETWTRRYASQTNVGSPNEKDDRKMKSDDKENGAPKQNENPKHPTPSSECKAGEDDNATKSTTLRASTTSEVLRDDSIGFSKKRDSSKGASTSPENGVSKRGGSDADDIFSSSFDVDEDVAPKTKKPSEEDAFSDMNDSDLDLFDFEESPLKKKPKKAL